MRFRKSRFHPGGFEAFFKASASGVEFLRYFFHFDLLSWANTQAGELLVKGSADQLTEIIYMFWQLHNFCFFSVPSTNPRSGIY